MARKTERVTNKRISGVRLLESNGGIVYCANCEKIVGSIAPTAYSLLMLVFCCTCGNYGCIEISRNKRRYDPTVRMNRPPKEIKGVCCCGECDERLFSMMDDRVENYSFFVECKCGETYDMKPTFERRLGETLKMFKKTKDNI